MYADVAPADGLVRSVLRLSGLPEDVSKESDILPLFRDHFSLAPTLDPRAVAEGLVAAGKPVAVMGQLDILASSAQGNSNAGRTKRGGANRRNRRGGAGAANKATAGGAGAASAASSSSSSSSAPADEAPSKDEAAHEEGSAAGEAGAGEGEGEEQQTVPDAGSSSSSSSASAAPAQAQAASIASAVADPEVPQTADDIGAHAGAVGSGSGATLCSSVYLGVSTETATYGRPNGEL